MEYYNDGYLVCFSLVEEKSLLSAQTIIERILHINGIQCPIFLIEH